MTTLNSERAWVKEAVALLAVVWTVPIAIILVGAPVALVITLLLWLARLARSAF